MAKKAKQTIDLDFLQNEGSPRTDLSEMFASSVATEGDMSQAAMIKIEKLLNNPYQPRLEVRDETIDELSGVIKAQGFQGVLVARPDPVNRSFYQITAGHRRREAARRAGFTSLPVVVRELTDEEMVTLAITENIQREDLTAVEEGKIYLLMADEMGYTHEQIAREIGRKRGYVENRIRAARAPRDVQELLLIKPDSIRAVASLIKVKDEKQRAEIIDGMLKGRLTVEDLRGYINAKVDAENALKYAERAFKVVEAKRARRLAEEATAMAHSGAAMQDTEPAQEAPSGQDGSAVPHAAETGPTGPQDAAAEHFDERPRLVEFDYNEQTQIRKGNGKLDAAVRYLEGYRQLAADRTIISAQELEALARVKQIADELYGRFAAVAGSERAG